MIDIDKLPNVQIKECMRYEENSPVNVAWNEYVKSGYEPLQWVIDKIGKNRAWKVINGKWNFDTMSLKFEILKGNTDSEFVELSYEDICKEMKWKSFTIVDEASCVPVKMTLDEDNAMYVEAIKKTNKKDIKQNSLKTNELDSVAEK